MFRRKPDLAAVIGSYDDVPGAPNFLSQYKNLLHHYVHQTASEEASTFWGAAERFDEIFLEMGGFDESYRQPSIEDWAGLSAEAGGLYDSAVQDFAGQAFKALGCGLVAKSWLLLSCLPWTELILRDRRFINDQPATLQSCQCDINLRACE